jgi:hypothetical protein
MSLFRLLSGLVVVLLVSCAAVAGRSDAGLDESLQEGWNTWRVTSNDAYRKSCCYRWSMGKRTQKTCDVDAPVTAVSTTQEAASERTEIQVYARIESGRASRILMLSPQCPAQALSPINGLGLIAAESSIAWLQTYVLSSEDVAEQALGAIAGHSGGVRQLIVVAEDQRLPMVMRERALFWMAQSNSDDAFDYVAMLLSRRDTGARGLY